MIYLIKGTVYSKMLTLNANAILNLYDLLFMWNIKECILQKVGNKTVVFTIDFHFMSTNTHTHAGTNL